MENYINLVLLVALLGALFGLCRKPRGPQKPDGKVAPRSRRVQMSDSGISPTGYGDGGFGGDGGGGH